MANIKEIWCNEDTFDGTYSGRHVHIEKLKFKEKIESLIKDRIKELEKMVTELEDYWGNDEKKRCLMCEQDVFKCGCRLRWLGAIQELKRLLG